MRKKQAHLLVFTLTTLAMVSGCANPAVSSTTTSTTQSGPKDFAKGQPDFSALEKTSVLRIGGWVAPPEQNKKGENCNTVERYKEIADSGINVIYRLEGTPEQMAVSCDNAKAAGIKLLALDYNLTNLYYEDTINPEHIHNLTSSYEAKEGLQGWMALDEPMKGTFDRLGKLHTAMKKEFPNSEFYVNLLPTYAPQNMLGTNDYQDYLDSYISKVNPEFISFDFYALQGAQSIPYAVANDVLYNLELVAQTTQKAHIPFFAFAANQDFGGASRNPNRAEVRWQVNNALAFGAKGIQYFCYWTPPDGTYPDAMIGLDGNQTYHYQDVQAVNTQLKAMDAAYLNYEWQGTLLSIGSLNASGLNSAYMMNPLQSLEGVTFLENEPDVLAGEFKDKDGKLAYYLSNFCDPHYHKKGKVSMKLLGAKHALVYAPEQTQALVQDLDSNSVFNYSLDEGEGIFVIPYAD